VRIIDEENMGADFGLYVSSISILAALTSGSNALPETTLKLVQVIHRHGERNPTSTYPNDPHANYDYGVKGFGQLLLSGKVQATDLGKLLRERYDGFISKEYSAEEVYVTSADADRAIQTALYEMKGLFWTDPSPDLIPVHTITPTEFDVIAMSKICPKYQHYLTEFQQSPRIKEIEKKQTKVYGYLTENAGEEIKEFVRAGEVFDILYVQEQNGLILPNWTSQIYPDKLLPSLRLASIYGVGTKELRRLLIGQFLEGIMRNFYFNINGSPETFQSEDVSDPHHRKAKLYIHSGHAHWVSGLLDIFGCTGIDLPDYTAAIFLELHQLNSTDGTREGSNYILKVFYYRGRIETPVKQLFLQNCSHPCTLNTFKSQYSYYILNRKQWTDECHE